jgi:hypothetical protein
MTGLEQHWYKESVLTAQKCNKSSTLAEKPGDPKGIRTPVTAVKGQNGGSSTPGSNRREAAETVPNARFYNASSMALISVCARGFDPDPTGFKIGLAQNWHKRKP